MKKISSVPKFQEPTKARINRIVQNVNKGHVVDTATVITKRLPDGRQQLFLHPTIAKQLGL